jgi:hypothetical protein
MNRDDINKHENKFVREPMSGCWLWTAAMDKHGYGMLWNGKQMDRAHRVFYASANGVNVSGVNVLHDCDNPSCVNPAHLHAGTQADNMKERTIRGRSGKRITQETADKIKTMLNIGAPQRTIAQLFGVSQRLVWNIDKGLIWNANK